MTMSDQELEQLVKQANSGDLDAQVYLGWAYDRFGPLPFNPAEAEKWLRSAAKGGSLEGLRRLCRFLYNSDRIEAVEKVSELLEYQDFYGHYLMGHILANGKFGVERNLNEAVRHLSVAGRKGHIVSQFDEIRLTPSRWYLLPIKFVRLVGLSLKFLWVQIRHGGTGFQTYR